MQYTQNKRTGRGELATNITFYLSVDVRNLVLCLKFIEQKLSFPTERPHQPLALLILGLAQLAKADSFEEFTKEEAWAFLDERSPKGRPGRKTLTRTMDKRSPEVQLLAHKLITAISDTAGLLEVEGKW